MYSLSVVRAVPISIGAAYDVQNSVGYPVETTVQPVEQHTEQGCENFKKYSRTTLTNNLFMIRAEVFNNHAKTYSSSISVIFSVYPRCTQD